MKRGFTLMELLIVIAVIGILMSIASVAYTSVQKKSRDSRRQSDLRAIQNAFEQYYADTNSLYPASCDAIATNTTYFPSGFPKDPKSTTAYYTAGTTSGVTIGNTCTTAGYYFSVSMESSTTGGNATNSTCAIGAGGFYCVNQLQ